MFYYILQGMFGVYSICHLAIRKYLGVGKRRYIKELSLPRHLVSFLMSLPLDCSKTLHENWDRIRTNTPNKQKSKPSRDGSKFDSGASLQALKTGTDSVFFQEYMIYSMFTLRRQRKYERKAVDVVA